MRELSFNEIEEVSGGRDIGSLIRKATTWILGLYGGDQLIREVSEGDPLNYINTPPEPMDNSLQYEIDTFNPSLEDYNSGIYW